MAPTVDINLFAYNAAATVGAAIESVLAQTWPDWRLTLIDDGSSDGTLGIMNAYAAAFPAIVVKRCRCNTGAVGAFQRAMWLGDADFVMPKSADDLIAPDFLERIMALMLVLPDCVMAHAGALSFRDHGFVDFEYPVHHRLQAVDDDPVARATHVMRRYTSAPSFWGVYRRDAVDRLAPIAYRAGWDHVLLAELALYGEIRHVSQVLYWRRGTGRPILDLARAATVETSRGLELDGPLSDPMWRMPCVTTAFAHVENFSNARLELQQRRALIDAACQVFRERWGQSMVAESTAVGQHIARVARRLESSDDRSRELAVLNLTRLITAVAMMLPNADLSAERAQISSLVRGRVACAA